MKKFILSLAVLTTTGLFTTAPTAKADCGSDLVNSLQDCFMSHFLAINVIIGNGVIYLNGPGVNDDLAIGCIASYQGQQNNCPSAPTIVVVGSGQTAPAAHSGISIKQNGIQ